MAWGTWVLLGGVAAASILALALGVLLARERRRSRLLALAEQRRLTQLGDFERTAREAEEGAAAARDGLVAERREHRRLVQDRNTARDWVRRLRRELSDARERAGAIGDPGNAYELVLRTAVELLGAEKGLLLARTDGDGDGDLDLVCSQGFDADPEHSAVVQHLARRTLSDQETLRVDHPSEIQEGTRNDADAEIDCLVAIPVYILDRFHGVVVAANKPGGFEEYDDEVLLALGDQAGAALDNSRLNGRLRRAYLTTVKVLADAIEAKDPFLRGHSDQVSDLVEGVARALELSPKEREELVFGSLLHDIGKIGISERILLKPGPLTAEERTVVQLHPRIGYRLVEQMPELQPISLAILHHHERFDGAGYPSGLRGEQIPLAARVIAIADAFSAMISERPYGQPMKPSEACDELKRCSGGQFDPELVRLFCQEVDRRSAQLEAPSPVDRALDDPELTQHHADGEGVLGLGSLAATDATTLIYSHSHLQREATALAQTAALNDRPFAVLVATLDDLPRINRQSGFTAGDAALRSVAAEVDRIATRVGGVAGRLSGRRIALLVPGASEQAAYSLAESLQPDTSITVSCACWEPGEDGPTVLDRARKGVSQPVPAG